MSLHDLSRLLVFLLATIVFGVGSAWAGGAGQEDLDKAMDVKLNATTLSDLSEAIQLAEGALQKGLDEENTEFAKKLLASALLQRARETGKQLLAGDNTLGEFQKKRDFTLADLERAVSLDPKQPETYLLIGQLNLSPGGDLKKAREAVEKALALDFEEPESQAKALLLRAALEEDPEKKLADLDKALELEPKNGAAYEARADVLVAMQKWDEAIAALDKAREYNPDSLMPLLQKSRIHLVQEKIDAALEDINQALNQSPDNAAVLLMRANIFETKGDLKKALADVDEVLKIKPDTPIVIRTKAVLLAEDKRFDEAVTELQKLLKADPKDAETLMQLAVLYNIQMKWEGAIQSYTQLLNLDPEQWQALRGRGDVYLNLGRQADAIADYESALKFQPKDQGILNNLAWVLATSPDPKLRNGKRAVELAKVACEVTEYKLAYILSTLAAAYAEMGDFTSAIQWSSKAVEIGDDQHNESLKQELESYKAGKPWREFLIEGKPAEDPENPNAGSETPAESSKPSDAKTK